MLCVDSSRDIYEALPLPKLWIYWVKINIASKDMNVEHIIIKYEMTNVNLDMDKRKVGIVMFVPLYLFLFIGQIYKGMEENKR